MPSLRAVIAVDLGKSRCRAVLFEPSAHGEDQKGAGLRRPLYDGVGAPGLASSDGVDAALEAILPLSAHLDQSVAAVSIGAAGAWTAPTAAAALARRLRAELHAPVVVTSDVVSAHAGALGGASGVLLIAGTGAAALGLGADDGADSGDDRVDRRDGARLVDGWGPELGDFGSGSWLGREALRAVLRASVDLGPSTVLTDAVKTPVGAPSAIPAWLASTAPLARRLATLAPLVLDAAEAGDRIAEEIVTEGIRLLVASAAAAAPASRHVALHGGLTDHLWFRAGLEAALRSAGRDVVPPAGDALDGALLLAERTDLPHERFVHRAE